VGHVFLAEGVLLPVELLDGGVRIREDGGDAVEAPFLNLAVRGIDEDGRTPHVVATEDGWDGVIVLEL